MLVDTNKNFEETTITISVVLWELPSNDRIAHMRDLLEVILIISPPGQKTLNERK